MSHHSPSTRESASSAELDPQRCRHELEAARARIAELEDSGRLLAGEARVLEAVAQGISLRELLDSICRLIEDISRGALCSIVLVDRAENQLRHGAAPSLPESFNCAIHGRPIVPDAGPCGMAAFTRQQVVSADISVDDRWDAHQWRELAAAHGIRACWSTPILASDGTAEATFAVYWREPRSPTDLDQRLIRQATHLAAVVIKHSEAVTAHQQSEQRLRSIADTIPGLVWSVEPDGEVDFLNQRWRDYTGLSLSDAQGWGWRVAIHPDDLGRIEDYWRQVLGSGSPGEFEARLRRHDGVFRWFLFRAVPLRDATGRVTKWYGQNVDIHDRRCAEEALQAAKARFEGILAIADDAIIAVDSDQRILLFNRGAERIFGYASSAILGRPLSTLLPERFAAMHDRHLETFARSPEISRSMAQRNEVFGRRKDGSEFPAEASISKLTQGDDVVFTVILREITERRRLENRLRQSERNLAEGQRLTKTGSWTLDFRTGETDWSVETCRIFGFPDPPPSPHYNAFRARVRPEDRAAVDNGLRESFETGEPRPLEYIFILPDGTEKHIETISQPVRDETGAVVRLMGTVMDVTARKRTEATLRAAELLARGQLNALTRTLDALALEAEPDRIREHVLRTIAEQLSAHSCSVWQREPDTGLMTFACALENDRLVTGHEHTIASISPSLRIEDIWPWPEVFRTGKPYLLEDIRQGPDFPWREHVLKLGIVTILIVPMLVAGEVHGVIGIRFTRARSFQAEEMELAQALANQAMLAMQLNRLSAESRRTAVIAERNRMARDIHDTLAQGFTGVIVQLEAAGDASSKGLAEDANAHMHRAAELARESLKEARRSVRALRPQALEEMSLGAALGDMISKMTAGTNLAATFSVRGTPLALPPAWEENLLRVGQEVLTNTLRHTRAKTFIATLSFQPSEIQLSMRDDGCGFDPTRKSDGFGLTGMRERVESMGGAMALKSENGAGTAVSIVLPLPSPSKVSV
ncbi:MAG: PAS domain S-box protein [Opitutaceae bacterium]|nr:PAS domain S-box protein [Opitutaceae bacterium]